MKKKTHIITPLSAILIILGAILILGGNHLGEYLVILGAISGIFIIEKDEVTEGS